MDDPALPATRSLLGEDARALVAAAVESSSGRLLDLRSDQVLYRPGVELKVRYRADVAWDGARPTHETFVAVTHVDGPPEGTLRLECDDIAVGLWRHPYDPALPGLLTATVPAYVEEFLGSVLAGPVSLDVRVYRPGRRAVVEASSSTGRVFLKIVRPKRVAALVERHERLAATLPVPEVVAADVDRGIVALRAIEGPSLRERLAAGRGRLMSATAFTDLLERLDDVDLGPSLGPARRSALCAVDDHVAMLARLLPSESGRLARVREQLLDRPAPQTPVTVHGDLHEAQIIVGVDGGALGLLDVDGVGTGARIDDLGNLLGHLATYARTQASHGARIRAYAASLERKFATRFDHGELRRRTAATVLGLATGPFRVQLAGWRQETRARIALAEQFLDQRHPGRRIRHRKVA